MEQRCPQCGLTLPQGVPAWVSRLTVGDVMSADPVTLGPEDTLMRAVEVMRARSVRRILVVIGGQLVGLLAQGDLNRAQPSALSDSQEEFNRVMEETQIARIMIKSPVTTTPEASLLDAAHTLHTTKFGALPVVRDGSVVGILTDSDLIRALADLIAQAG
jgi:acetoin utilization protein AcuB